MLPRIAEQGLAGFAQQRPTEQTGAELPQRQNRCQPQRAGRAHQVQKQRLRLVVLVMGAQQAVSRLDHCAQCAVAGLAFGDEVDAERAAAGLAVRLPAVCRRVQTVVDVYRDDVAVPSQ